MLVLFSLAISCPCNCATSFSASSNFITRKRCVGACVSRNSDMSQLYIFVAGGLGGKTHTYFFERYWGEVKHLCQYFNFLQCVAFYEMYCPNSCRNTF